MPADNTAADPTPTDTPPPKRRLWQIHLSTAVVMMLVAATLLYLNVVGRAGSPKSIGAYEIKLLLWLKDPGDEIAEVQMLPKSYGWPWSYRVEEQMIAILPGGAVSKNTDGPQWSSMPEDIKWDVLISLAILFAIAVGMEACLRRSKP